MAKFKKADKKTIRMIPLGGAGQVNRNMFAYECGQDILIMDCGMGFPGFETPGVDAAIPDITYLEKEGKLHQVRGIIITHAHYDHFGALPYIVPHIDAPVYGSKLTIEFARSTLEESGLDKKTNLVGIDPEETKPISFGSFQVTPFRVNHSVPDSL